MLRELIKHSTEKNFSYNTLEQGKGMRAILGIMKFFLHPKYRAFVICFPKRRKLHLNVHYEIETRK